ncbi:MAG: LemA family protein [Gemmatimonadetes bacterium]|nr:LemA family protein [Gemmatimonadota bacterium]MCH8255881.1 LemA family protein [Gemmatimonadota bacterium]
MCAQASYSRDHPSIAPGASDNHRLRHHPRRDGRLGHIGVQLTRRHDLIPNLVNAVRGAMEFEKETLDAVISARNQAVKDSG